MLQSILINQQMNYKCCFNYYAWCTTMATYTRNLKSIDLIVVESNFWASNKILTSLLLVFQS